MAALPNKWDYCGKDHQNLSTWYMNSPYICLTFVLVAVRKNILFYLSVLSINEHTFWDS